MKELKWNVYVDSINRRRIEIYNIFDHASFKKGCDKAWIECKNNFEKFEKDVYAELMYYFWSKCEWEIILSDFPESKKFKKEKVDVFSQVRLNWDIFIDYVWNQYTHGMVDMNG